MKTPKIRMARLFIGLSCVALALLTTFLRGQEQPAAAVESDKTAHKAAFIICSETVDPGLYESVKRRTEAALAEGVTCLIYEMDTFGGRVDSAYEIWCYFLQDVNKRPGVHTAAFVRTKAISAGALISVACQDIIMKENAQLGDCAPISMGGELQGVEREKIESPLRSFFATAAKDNGYPEALCKAMVTVGIEVYQVRNLKTGENEYFEADLMPADQTVYDLQNKRRVDTAEQLLTVDADTALDYGLARAVVQGTDEQAREGVLAWLETSLGIIIVRPGVMLQTNWSEQMVRWINSPAVSGVLMLIGMLGIYIEIKAPGVGLPAAVAVVAFAILFGSRYFIGLANWWEIAVFFLGVVLVLLEIFIIPGFGVAGILGLIMIFFGLVAMMVSNPPDQLPIPVSPADWEMFQTYLISMFMGLAAFVVVAVMLARYLPGMPVARGLILNTPDAPLRVRAGEALHPVTPAPMKVGQVGVTLSTLRPSGIVLFDNQRIDVVARGELVDPGQKVRIVAIEGNSIIVQSIREG